MLSAAAAELHPHATAALSDAGLLVAADHERVTTPQDDHEDAPVALTWSERDDSLTYFSPTAGLVVVRQEKLLRRRVEMTAALTAFTAEFNLPRGRPPFALVKDLLWEVGDARLGRRRERVSVWFARRLWDPTVRRRVEEKARARPHQRQRVLLTSSRPERLGAVALPGVAVVSLRDVLVRPEVLSVSAEVLDALLGGALVQPDMGPISLSPDETHLFIDGANPVVFRSERHKTAISKLVSAYRAGRRVRAAEITGGTSFNQFFGARRWKRLSRHLTSEHGTWSLKP